MVPEIFGALCIRVLLIICLFTIVFLNNIAMNIAFVIPSMLRGGAERAMSILCNEFARKGDVVFLYLTEIADNVEYPLVDDVNLVDLTVNLEPYIRKIPIFIKRSTKYALLSKILLRR